MLFIFSYPYFLIVFKLYVAKRFSFHPSHLGLTPCSPPFALCSPVSIMRLDSALNVNLNLIIQVLLSFLDIFTQRKKQLL